jgi:hypothetical protein
MIRLEADNVSVNGLARWVTDQRGNSIVVGSLRFVRITRSTVREVSIPCGGDDTPVIALSRASDVSLAILIIYMQPTSTGLLTA